MDTGWYRSWSFDKKMSTRERVLWALARYEGEFGRTPPRCLLNTARARELPEEMDGMVIRSYPCILDDEVRLLVEDK